MSVLCLAADLDAGHLLAAVCAPGGTAGLSAANAELAATGASHGGARPWTRAWRASPPAGEGVWAAVHGGGAVAPGPEAGGALFPVLAGSGGMRARVNFGGDLAAAPFLCAPPSADYRPVAAAARSGLAALRTSKVGRRSRSGPACKPRHARACGWLQNGKG